MRAAVLEAVGGPLHIHDLDPAPLGPRDVQVSIKASGICRSDLSVIQGHIPNELPVILGHEGAGVVEAIGVEVRSIAVGDRVIGSFMPACGVCPSCLRDEPYLCFGVPVHTADRGTLPGGAAAKAFCGLGTFADVMVAHEASLVRVDTDLPDEQLALIGCGVTTGLSAVFNAAQLSPGSTVAVIGCGGVGQAVIQGAGIAGAAQIIAIDPVAFKRDTALKLGASHVLDPTADDLASQILEVTRGAGVDVAFEVVGRSATVNQAVSAARPGGLAVVVGIVTDDVVPVPREAFVMGKTVRGCLYGSARVRRDFQRYINLAESGRLDLSGNVTSRISLDEVNTGFEAMENGDVIRTVIV